jgi:hypothetical protein
VRAFPCRRTNESSCIYFFLRSPVVPSSIDRSFFKINNKRALNDPTRSSSYAFVEFRSTRDAEDAYYDMYVQRVFFFLCAHTFSRHGKHFEGYRLSIQVCVSRVQLLAIHENTKNSGLKILLRLYGAMIVVRRLLLPRSGGGRGRVVLGVVMTVKRSVTETGTEIVRGTETVIRTETETERGGGAVRLSVRGREKGKGGGRLLLIEIEIGGRGRGTL